MDISYIRLIESMNDRPIAFNRHYVSIGCSINAALMLSQLVYWTSRTKNPDGWIYKDHTEWTDETGLSRKEQYTARKSLKSLGFISEMKHGIPPRVYFMVERENLYNSLLNNAQNLAAPKFEQNGNINNTDLPTRMGVTEHTYGQKGAFNTESTQRLQHRVSCEESQQIEPTAKQEQKTRFSAKKFLIENGVSQEVAQEFIDLRNKKKKTVTERVLKIIFNQAELAKLSNDIVFQIIVVKGWDSFNASWNYQEALSLVNSLTDNKETTLEKNVPPKTVNVATKKWSGM